MEERKGFGSNFGFLMAAIGSAVGLGNIWGFPNKMGANGGFTFLIIYLILAACCGFIVMMGELALGRKTGRGAIGAYKVLSKRFKWLGWLGVLSAFLILGFYCALGGYCLKYVTLNVGNLFHAGFGTGTLDGAGVFGALMANQGEAVIYGLIFVALTMIIVMGGVGGGIEKVCSVGMPALFVMLVICIIRSCTLEGASEGLKYMFVPGWALANGVIKEAPDFFSVVSTAGGQMFFSLSLGMAAMITYGSYLDKKENLQKNAIIIVVMDTLVALMAGLCVIPGRFALDPTGKLGGPSLLFVTMQNVFDRMGAAGPIFGILFYLLVVFAAVSSSISLLEAVVAHFVDKARDEGKGDKRKLYSLIGAIGAGILCVIVCLDALGNAGISPADILGMRVDPSDKVPTWSADWLDFFDCIAEGILMPLGALLMSIMYGWELGPEVVHAEATCEGQKFGAYGWFRICIKYITPLAMLLVLYGQIKEFFF
ncbi:sodium-dependent transporter [Oscillospiraceae bacterium CLA-AA-H272]|uniref:Sodium-dependent transporter n=1 Tax=Brotocaccenecus cirricatena TaxID=3064195 RepID=A0AAE3DDE8_9FIRM|nr:sodium-dependent transporter [Brotocaccenecus cirricatena]MCC2128330.1 sodium-dependent transporter [Brotocaccenecus cirricatena]